MRKLLSIFGLALRSDLNKATKLYVKRDEEAKEYYDHLTKICDNDTSTLLKEDLMYYYKFKVDFEKTLLAGSPLYNGSGVIPSKENPNYDGDWNENKGQTLEEY